MIKKLLYICLLSYYGLFTITNGARILGVFVMSTNSHYVLSNTLMRGLAEAGHDVTMVSPYYDKKPVQNGTYRNIVLTGFVEEYTVFSKKRNHYEADFINKVTYLLGLHNAVFPIIEKTLQHDNFQNLIKSGTEQFDVVVVEQFHSDAFKALAWYYNAHLVVLSPGASSCGTNSLVGSPTELAYNPMPYTNFPTDMNFFQRVHNTIIYSFEYLANQLYFLPQHNQLIQQHFPGCPDIFELLTNVSLVLTNSHESFTPSKPLVPNLINVGGLHIQPAGILPENLQRYLDESTDGVIYFSMGSHLKSSGMSFDKMQYFIQAFKRLKQNVLWKWEAEVLPGKPANVRIEKWVPQMEVLAHPNVKVFITHGGLLSFYESIYCGVPVLAIPVFYDQASNAINGVQEGYALSLPYHDPKFSEEAIYSYLQQLLTNSSFAENAKTRSNIFHDRVMSPIQTATHWIDYIIRHKGAQHLRSRRLQLPWYKYFLVDVVLFLLLFVLAIVILVSLFCFLLYRLLRKQNKIKIN
ncbi:UDP-glycosyltransferase UGT5 [Diabrotica virgifera virgifera]|uniref:UDP-glucuronosyltransferase n=1 Tax=Diabrotica virgifera virgifera TaxID=50390 RepID=A0A6P7FK33_DIAVI|nr:UDP-glycosyltransferase UGT5 [Diabrotica virgifera virgifera]